MTPNRNMTKHCHIFMRFPEGKYKAATFSFDDGSVEDMWLVELLKSHGMKATFNLNTGWIPDSENFDFSSLPEHIFCTKDICHRMTEEQLRATFPGSGMELATHGATHAVLSWLEDDAAIREIIRDREFLEDIMGESVRGHAFAQGIWDQRSVELLSRAGIVYARNGNFHQDFALPRDFMMWGPTCTYNNTAVFERFRDLKDTENCIWFDGVSARLLYVFGHSYELTENDDFGLMEKNVEILAETADDTWFCTNMEYYRYATAFNNLDFTLARDSVYNPSAIPVWILANDKIVEIPPNERVMI